MFSSFMALLVTAFLAISAPVSLGTSEADLLTLDDFDVSGVTCGCTKHDFLVDGH